MFLAKVDIAALILHSFSAGVMSLLLVYAGVVGDGSPLAHLLSICLFLVNSGTVLRVLWRGRRRRDRRGQAPTSANHAAQRAGEL
jgi:membrane protein implicated in regulation of membrane protease activity